MTTAAVEARERELVERFWLNVMALISGGAANAEEDHAIRLSAGLALIRQVREEDAQTAEDYAVVWMGDRSDYAAELCDGIAGRIREGLALG